MRGFTLPATFGPTAYGLQPPAADQGHPSHAMELKDRIMATMDHFNQDPVVHTGSYKLDQAA